MPLNPEILSKLFLRATTATISPYQAKHWYEWTTNEYLTEDEFLAEMLKHGYKVNKKNELKIKVPTAISYQRFHPPFVFQPTEKSATPY